jgi:hypothetical protein
MRRFATVSAVILGAVLAAVATGAAARTFNIVQSGLDSWTIYDPATVERPDGGPVRRVWTVRVMRNISSSTPPVPGYVRTLTDYDCDRGEFRWREFSAFSRSGDLLLNRINPSYSWERSDKAADTLAAHNAICGQGTGQNAVSADSIAKLVITLMRTWDPSPAQQALAAAPSKAPASKAAPAKAPSSPKPPAAKSSPPAAAVAAKPVAESDLWP